MSKNRTCCVPGCGFKGQTGLHSIPKSDKEPERRKIWIETLLLDSEKLTSYSKVCEAHFAPSDIVPKSNRLKQGTNPTRNLPVRYTLLAFCKCNFLYSFIKN